MVDRGPNEVTEQIEFCLNSVKIFKLIAYQL